MRTPCTSVLLLLLALAGPALADDEPPRIAVTVFNFGMKSDTPDWLWLEKGLADRITTDLFQDRTIAVVDRDHMEALAEKLSWVPEMMTEADRLNRIHRELRPAYLVSGVYEVNGDDLTISATIIDFKTNKEISRRSASGKTAETLELIRKLSAEVLAALTRRKSEEILAELPVWTRSVPAAKALYEGVNLYDQGRYAEAWLLFRQAAHADPSYVEPQYWVGKMYYFMDRYDHARSTFEGFLYRNFSHPRVGDALVEYLHTYEKLDTPPETLVRLYANLAARYPQAVIAVTPFRTTADIWLERKQATLLTYLGRFEEALKLVAIQHPIRRDIHPNNNSELIQPYLVRNHLRGGAMFSPTQIRDCLGLPEAWPHMFACSEGRSSWTTSAGGCSRQRGDLYFRGGCGLRTLLTPSGHVFKFVAVFPVTDPDNNGRLAVTVSREQQGDHVLVQQAPLGPAARDGLTLTNLPWGGWLQLGITYEAQRPFEAVRIVAEVEPMGPRGSVEVSCRSTQACRVEVDGRAGRLGSGLVGLVPPGRHVVRFVPLEDDECHAAVEVPVTVEAGKVSQVAAALPWKKDGPLASWRETVLAGRDESLPQGYWNEVYYSQPAIEADDEAVRVLWSSYDDLWAAESTDGRTFGPLRRLELPVSSGWIECKPRCIRDETGRFLLTFSGNRNMQHNMKRYLCWSRDFVHWSAPALLTDTMGRPSLPPGVAEPLPTALQPSDYPAPPEWNELPPRFKPCEVKSYWASSDPGWRLAYRCAGGSLVLTIGIDDPPALVLLRKTADGSWERSVAITGIAGKLYDVAWHPRWGHILAWLALRPNAPLVGPYVTCGASLDPLFQWKLTPQAAESLAATHLAVARALDLDCKFDEAQAAYEKIIEAFGATEAARDARRRLEAMERFRLTYKAPDTK